MTVDGYEPRFNIAPGQPQPVIPNETPDEIAEFRWGLVPQWMGDPDDGFVNARSETAHEKPAFRHAWERRPCLVLSTEFYEWRAANGGPKRPYRVYQEDDPAFAIAGLWEEREAAESDAVLRTVMILTTEPNDVVEPIHDRMPVVLPREDERRWLAADPDERRRSSDRADGRRAIGSGRVRLNAGRRAYSSVASSCGCSAPQNVLSVTTV